MVNPHKIERKLPSLLIDGTTGGYDPLYQKKRSQLSQLKKNQPGIFNNLINNVNIALAQLDFEAEQAGFQHLDFDTQGNLIRYSKLNKR